MKQSKAASQPSMGVAMISLWTVSMHITQIEYRDTPKSSLEECPPFTGTQVCFHASPSACPFLIASLHCIAIAVGAKRLFQSSRQHDHCIRTVLAIHEYFNSYAVFCELVLTTKLRGYLSILSVVFAVQHTDMYMYWVSLQIRV